MFQWYRAMRIAALALVAVAAGAVAGGACSRRSLQADDGGAGTTGLDAAADTIRVDARITDIAPPTDAWTPTDAQIIGDVNCGSTVTFQAKKLPIDLLLVVDRSVDQATWNQMTSALVDLTSELDTLYRYRWGLKLFPEDGPACGAGTVTNKIDVPIGDGDYLRLKVALAAATPTGNGTPTAAALTAARAYLGAVADENPKYMMLVTDGAPTCAGTAGMLTSDPVQAQADAIAAIARESFSTFVMGAGVTAPGDVDALNQLAVAGGYPRAGSINFFPSSDITELRISLTPMWDYTCTFPVQPVRPDVVSIFVTLNGAGVPYDETRQNGWAYTDASHTALSLYGPACDQLISSWEAELKITYGCLLL